MAARGAGAALWWAAAVLGLLLLWAGSAGARVHHLTLKVRSAPHPALLARPPAALSYPPGRLRGAVGPVSGRLPRAGVRRHPPTASSRCLHLSFFAALWAPPCRSACWAPLCCAFPVIIRFPRIPLAPIPAFLGLLFLSHTENVWRGIRTVAGWRRKCFAFCWKWSRKLCAIRGLNMSCRGFGVAFAFNLWPAVVYLPWSLVSWLWRAGWMLSFQM